MITTEGLKRLLAWAESHTGCDFKVLVKDGDKVLYGIKDATMLCNAKNVGCILLEISKIEQLVDREE